MPHISPQMLVSQSSTEYIPNKISLRMWMCRESQVEFEDENRVNVKMIDCNPRMCTQREKMLFIAWTSEDLWAIS